MPKTNKKPINLLQKTFSNKYLRLSLIISGVLTILLLLEIFTWLTTSADNAWNVLPFTFLEPVYLVLFAIAAFCCVKGSKGLTERQVNLTVYVLVLVLFLYFAVLTPIKSTTNHRWDCENLTPSGISCGQFEKQIVQEDRELQNISYEHTHIKAYLPSYALKNYRALNGLENHQTSISIYYSTDASHCSGQTGCGYLVSTMNDTAQLKLESAEPQIKTIGKTKWGAPIKEYSFSKSPDGWQIDYVTQFDGTYLVIQLGKAIIFDLDDKQITMIFNSMQRAN